VTSTEVGVGFIRPENSPEEELMRSDKKECPNCAVDVPKDRQRCPICGYEFPQPKSRLFTWIAIILILLFLIPLIRYLMSILK
jgi:RNA polymerase subunit RPABC4/transcription elongation factor Spt4